MRSVRIAHIVVAVNQPNVVGAKSLGRQVATEIGTQLARQRIADTPYVRLEMARRVTSATIRPQVSSALRDVARGRK